MVEEGTFADPCRSADFIDSCRGVALPPHQNMCCIDQLGARARARLGLGSTRHLWNIPTGWYVSQSDRFSAQVGLAFGLISEPLVVDGVNEIACGVAEIETPEAPFLLKRPIRISAPAARTSDSVASRSSTPIEMMGNLVLGPLRGDMKFAWLLRVAREKGNPPHVERNLQIEYLLVC